MITEVIETKRNGNDYELTVRPYQIGIMLSVRVRVGSRVLRPIKKKTNLLVKFSYIILMFWDSEKNNYTLTKTININLL